MSTIAVLTSNENGANSLTDINANFAALNADKGTVTAVSVVTANGISGSVATATTTPAITLSLGAITPTTVNGHTFTTGSSTFTGTAGQTYTFPSATATIAGIASTQTLTNKRITKRVLALSAGSATPAIDTDSYDVVHITAQNAAITSFTTNLTGTPVDGDTLRISITDDGTGRALTWGASFEASTVALPTTTVASTRLDVGFYWNSETSKWRCVAVV